MASTLTNDTVRSETSTSTAAEQTRSAGSLGGITVLDFTHVLSGPFCTMVLGDLGAEVIKVERLGGEETRQSDFAIDGYSEQFAIVNRNKRSIAIDLRSDAGRDAILRIVAKADVVVENFRPGTMERLGLGYENLKVLRPNLIYCSISGFGRKSSSRDLGAFDIVAQGMSGLLSVTGTAEGELVKIGVPVCDMTAGLYAAVSICASLVRRDRTGLGENIDVPLVDAGMSLLVWEAAQLWSDGGTTPRPTGTAHRNRAPYQVFPASDGKFIVGAGNEATWEALCRAIDRNDLRNDDRFRTNWGRISHEAELVALLIDIFRQEAVDHWVQKLRAAGCPCSPILDVGQAFESPHAREHDMVLTTDNPTGGRPLPTIGFPMHLAEAPLSVRLRPPLVGEHTIDVLSRYAGLNAEQIKEMVDARQIQVESPRIL